MIPRTLLGVVVYLASDAAHGGLTGRCMRVDGNKVNRLLELDRHRIHSPARTGGAVTAQELTAGMPKLYGAAPTGRSGRR